jgi:hypothetical protein
MDKIDKTKENIGVTELDESTRKKLFDKFVNAGGEIMTERQKRRTLMIDRDSQRRMQRKLDNQRERQAAGQNMRRPRQASLKKTPMMKKKESLSLVEHIRNLKLRIKLRFFQITRYNGLYFNIRFLEKFNNIYKPALMEIQVVFLNLFKKDLKTGNAIISRLDNMRPLYYELIEAMGSLYDKMSADQIVDHYRNFPDVPKKASELREPLMDLFKKIYLIKIYENLSLDAMMRAVDLYVTVKNKGDGVDSSTKKKIRHDLFIIFHKLYPRLHWLFCHYYGVYYPYDDEAIEDYLSIQEYERFGKRIFTEVNDIQAGVLFPGQDDALPAEEFFTHEAADEAPEEKPERTMPEPLRRGLELMRKLDLQNLRKKYDNDGLFAKVSDTDKVFITYLIFSEFDREYSFILTTNKIKINTDFIRRGEYNYKTKLNDLYDEMRKPQEALKNYALELAHYEKARRERPVGNTQYFEYTKRLESINKKKHIAGNLARMSVRAYMDKVAEEMNILIEDMAGSQKLISNPQDVLEFNSSIEGDRKINGLKIYESIAMAHHYSPAISYRLSERGELSGGNEMDEGTPEQEALLQGAPAEEEKKTDTTEEQQSKSIIQELDDML